MDDVVFLKVQLHGTQVLILILFIKQRALANVISNLHKVISQDSLHFERVQDFLMPFL